MLSHGLLANDISRANETSAGVCVLRPMRLPPVPPALNATFRLREVTKALQKAQREDAAARAAFRARDPLALTGGVAAGSSSEVLPKQQVRTAGKPSLCRPMDSPLELAALMHAPDSTFTSEHRANYWWKTALPGQKAELKEHVRPLDSWTNFRDMAVKQAPAMREPIHTY